VDTFRTGVSALLFVLCGLFCEVAHAEQNFVWQILYNGTWVRETNEVDACKGYGTLSNAGWVYGGWWNPGSPPNLLAIGCFGTKAGTNGTVNLTGFINKAICNPTTNVWDGVKTGTFTCKVASPPPPSECAASSLGLMHTTTGYTTGPQDGAAVVADYPVTISRCFQGCATFPDQSHQPSPIGPCYQVEVKGANGFYEQYCNVYTVRTGGKCAGNEPATVPPEPSNVTPPDTPGDCPKGMISLGVDSQRRTICTTKTVPTDTNKSETTKPPVTTTNPDGSSVKVTETTRANSDGSTTKEVTTQNTSPTGVVTTNTVVTTTKPDGTAGGVNDKNVDKGDICTAHPELNMCRNSQVLGTCGQISCTGDAIQCAVARQTAILACKAEADAKEIQDAPATALGNQILGGADPAAGTLPTKANASVVDIGTVDRTGWLGAGTCFADLTVTVMAKPIVIPFSSACQYLLGLRYAIMLAAMLFSFKLLSGSILRS
jgi:hypothetical protein